MPERESAAPPVPAEVGGGEPGFPERRVTSGELERVIRRAAELQFDEGTDVGDLEVREVVRIGEEVGLDARHVRRALAEVQAESLLPALPVDTGVPARLWGAGIVRHSRAVRGSASEVQELVEGWFSDRESLRCVRRQPGRSLWEPAGGLVKQMQRALDVGGHGYVLAKARNVQLAVEDLEEGWSLVTIAVDLRNLRAEQATGWLLGLGLTGTASAVGMAVLAGGAIGVIVVPLVAVGSWGVATWAAGRTIAKVRGRIELVVLGLLDRLEQGELGRDRGEKGWRDWLGSGAKPDRAS